jgi:hypothetical protein
LICIIEDHREKLSLNPTPPPSELETRADFGFVTRVHIISLPEQSVFV